MIAKAIGDVVVDQPGRLHISVADGGANKVETAFAQVFAHRLRSFGLGGYVGHTTPGILHGLATDKLPQIGIEAAKFLLYPDKRLRILD